MRAGLIGALFSVLAGCSGGSHSVVPSTGATLHTADAASASIPSGGTLYVADTDRVYALPLGASDAIVPLRTIVPHPLQAQQSVDGIATAADGTLYVLEHRTFSGGRATVVRCRVVAESATADGSPAALATTPCDSSPAQALGIARNALGGYDVLYRDTATAAFSVGRMANDGSVNSTLVLTSPSASALATDAGGHDYVVTGSGEILKYKAAVADPSVLASDVQIPGSPTNVSAIAVSPAADRTAYVVEGPAGNQTIDAIPPGSSTVSRTIGPFTNHSVSALAVDSQGNLYAAVNPNGGTYAYSTVRVYGPDAQGSSTPSRIIAPAVQTTLIRGLAIAE